jgi:ribosomal-protein-alanine N-acetyltransferase
VVAVAAQEPVGYCYCSVEEGEHGHLIRMAVHPTWQGRGIGTRLLSEALLFFRQAGVRHVTLNTQEENEGAQRLYCKFGVRLVGWEAVALWMDL